MKIKVDPMEASPKTVRRPSTAYILPTHSIFGDDEWHVPLSIWVVKTSFGLSVSRMLLQS